MLVYALAILFSGQLVEKSSVMDDNAEKGKLRCRKTM